MKTGLFLASAFFLIMCANANAGLFEDDTPAPALNAAGASFVTAFSPQDAVASHVVQEILSAHDSVRLAARAFISKPVSEALVKSARQGRNVMVILDAKHNKTGYSAATFLQTMGVVPHVTRADMGLSGGYIIIDDKEVVLGNIAGLTDESDEKKNWSQVLIIHDVPELAAKYLADWKVMWAASDIMKAAK